MVVPPSQSNIFNQFLKFDPTSQWRCSWRPFGNGAIFEYSCGFSFTFSVQANHLHSLATNVSRALFFLSYPCPLHPLLVKMQKGNMVLFRRKLWFNPPRIGKLLFLEKFQEKIECDLKVFPGRDFKFSSILIFITLGTNMFSSKKGSNRTPKNSARRLILSSSIWTGFGFRRIPLSSAKLPQGMDDVTGLTNSGPRGSSKTKMSQFGMSKVSGMEKPQKGMRPRPILLA